MDHADDHDTGFPGGAGIWAPVGEGGLALFGEGFFGRTSYSPEGADGETKNLIGGFGGATYRIGDPESNGLFLVGKVGVLARDSDLEEGKKETMLAGGGGIGFIIPKEKASPWILAQFIGAKCTKFIVISLGVTIGGQRDSSEGS
jgi:hypothetical protein